MPLPQPDTREWKLTILDPAKTVAVPEGRTVTREDDRITVPYVLTGAGITRLSLVIADPNGQVLYYGPLDRDAADCTAVFPLPRELQYKTCGKDYSAYLLAEGCNGPCRTDYSSALCPIDIPK